ncbi:MAG: DUF3667 domain-containing protein [Bacteroidota bacterium]
MVCKNCGTELNDTQNFCYHCGAKVIRNRLTPKVIAHQVNEEFFSIDNKLLLTFIDLFKRPEDVINGYIDGTRKKYINVIQYFAISLTLVGIQVFLMNTFFSEYLDMEVPFLEGLPEEAKNDTNNPFADIDFEIFNDYQSFFYIVSVPISALSTWLAYYIIGERRFNFTEHLVINLYYSAQVIIVTAFISIFFLVFGFDYLLISSFLTLLTFIYFFFVLKRVFNNTFWDTVLRYMLVMAAFFGIFVGSLILGVIVGFVIVKLKT